MTTVALINTNLIKPPIAPIGLDYIAEALASAGHPPSLLDLCWEKDWREAISRFFDKAQFTLVGVTLRNTDDCAFPSRQSFLPEFMEIIKTIRRHTDATIIAGGVGFSTMPEQVIRSCGADAGVWGDGEFVLPQIAEKIKNKQDWHDLPGIVFLYNGDVRRNPPEFLPLDGLPLMSRTWADNRRYFLEGGQAGFETKRGCPNACIYCADPLAKGKSIRLRPPKALAEEMINLLAQDIDHFHTCDSEFNLPLSHAIEVCQEFIKHGLGEKMRWYAYCSPTPFSKEFARLMRLAGCVGINFGVDSGDAETLRRLGRNFTPEDIANAVQACREADITVMLDLLLGAPGESRESICRTVDLMKNLKPDRVGVTVGARVYPGTALEKLVMSEGRKGGLTGVDDPWGTIFFLEPDVAPFIFHLLDDLIKDDRRFLFFDPSKPDRNYNYNANELLVKAIHEGYRGAYWDILRRYDETESPFVARKSL